MSHSNDSRKRRHENENHGAFGTPENRKRADVDVNLRTKTASTKARHEELRQEEVAELMECEAIIGRLKTLGMSEELIALQLPDKEIMRLPVVEPKSAEPAGVEAEAEEVTPGSAEPAGNEAEKGKAVEPKPAEPSGGEAGAEETVAGGDEKKTKTQGKTFAQSVDPRRPTPRWGDEDEDPGYKPYQATEPLPDRTRYSRDRCREREIPACSDHWIAGYCRYGPQQCKFLHVLTWGIRNNHVFMRKEKEGTLPGHTKRELERILQKEKNERDRRKCAGAFYEDRLELFFAKASRRLNRSGRKVPASATGTGHPPTCLGGLRASISYSATVCTGLLGPGGGSLLLQTPPGRIGEFARGVMIQTSSSNTDAAYSAANIFNAKNLPHHLELDDRQA
jgi:hypothetical protein